MIDLSYMHHGEYQEITLSNPNTSISFRGRCLSHFSTEDFARKRSGGSLANYSEILIYTSDRGWISVNVRYRPGKEEQGTTDVQTYFYGPFPEIEDLHDKMIFECGRDPQYWKAAFKVAKEKTLE